MVFPTHCFKTPCLQALDARHHINKIPLQYTASRYHVPIWLCLAVQVRHCGANPDLAADTLVLRRRFLQKMVQEGLLEPTESKDSYRVSCQRLLPLFRAGVNDNSDMASGICHASTKLRQAA